MPFLVILFSYLNKKIYLFFIYLFFFCKKWKDKYANVIIVYINL